MKVALGIRCKAGERVQNANDGKLSCVSCTAGYFSKGGSAESCIVCSPGRYGLRFSFPVAIYAHAVHQMRQASSRVTLLRLAASTVTTWATSSKVFPAKLVAHFVRSTHSGT